ncbi:MAG: phosphoenolpyruvate synthase [Flavobacteriaceae bacterium]|nr:phosphoenolpyruvate synthase [Flavobacteriaceae bacterium]
MKRLETVSKKKRTNIVSEDNNLITKSNTINQLDVFTLPLKSVNLDSIDEVGGKNASLGTMINNLSPLGIKVPDGFAVTVSSFRYFLTFNNLEEKIKVLSEQILRDDITTLQEAGNKIRTLIINAKWPKEISDAISKSYSELCMRYHKDTLDVAVRSSATCEDLPDASFAGQQESFLNINGIEAVLRAIKCCFASLYNDRAISYRKSLAIDSRSIGISVCIQKMVRSDLGASGVAFSIDTESGFKDIVLINGAYGLGESIVQGTIETDEFIIYKPLLKKGYDAIIEKQIGTKNKKLVYNYETNQSINEVDVALSKQNQFCLTDEQLLTLSRWVCLIEDYYTSVYNKWCPVDVEWALDGETNTLFIVQARPETVHSNKSSDELITYAIDPSIASQKIILSGIAVGDRIGQGNIRILDSMEEYYHIAKNKPFRDGDVLVTDMTDPNWEPLMKKASGIITNRGGRTCHAAIVAREMGVPAIVGTQEATQVLVNGMAVTVSCAQGSIGNVYEGIIPFTIEKTSSKDLPKITTDLMLNVGSPDIAFKVSKLPNSGVGLAREEFIINHYIKAHPLALLKHRSIGDKKLSSTIQNLISGYKDEETFFIEKLSYGIAKIAAAFYPKDVIVRLSDFKTNEYINLLGGQYFESPEENPMIGWRGASRYYSEVYKPAFELECKAIKRVRETMGLDNVIVMIPFCRTVNELKEVYKTMHNFGLDRGINGLQIYLMAELPSNIIMAPEFAKYIDGFSIGSNDLTQLILGLDRDSELVSHLYDERSPAIKKAISSLIATAKMTGTKIGICGQGPSDHPDFAQFLVQEGIDSISVTPDSVLKTIASIASLEKDM